MTPDDPRHGQDRGYSAGCREACCRTARADWARHYRTRQYLHGDLSVPAEPTVRRVRALVALGWSTVQIDDRIGRRRTYTAAVIRHADRPIHRATAAMYDAIYGQMSMELPPTGTRYERQRVARLRNYAQSRGWAPPLAWDDIDNDPAPIGQRHHWSPDYDGRDLIDPATVLRILAGEVLPANAAERGEVVRRWKAAGESEAALCARMGWHEGRYGREDKSA